MAFETQIPIELASFRQGITTETSTALCALEATRDSLVMLNSLAFTVRRLCSSLPACIFYYGHYHGKVRERSSESSLRLPIAQSTGPIFHGQRLGVERHF